jgi:hypothetical protein
MRIVAWLKTYTRYSKTFFRVLSEKGFPDVDL